MTKLTVAQIEARIHLHGIRHPIVTYTQSQQTRLDLPSACAMLMMESNGGENVFGHDPGNAIQGGFVNRSLYEQMRHSVAIGHPSQGVGPCQLTSTALQDEADKLGGCWLIDHNMHVGFGFLKNLIDQHGHEGGFTAYNGSGSMAEAYGRRADALRQEFAALLT